MSPNACVLRHTFCIGVTAPMLMPVMLPFTPPFAMTWTMPSPSPMEE